MQTTWQGTDWSVWDGRGLLAAASLLLPLLMNMGALMPPLGSSLGPWSHLSVALPAHFSTPKSRVIHHYAASTMQVTVCTSREMLQHQKRDTCQIGSSKCKRVKLNPQAVHLCIALGCNIIPAYLQLSNSMGVNRIAVWKHLNYSFTCCEVSL